MSWRVEVEARIAELEHRRLLLEVKVRAVIRQVSKQINDLRACLE
jgi:hypothetical protein